MLEGLLHGRSGLFPAGCVREVHLRNPDTLRSHQKDISSVTDRVSRVAGRREVRAGGHLPSSTASTPTMTNRQQMSDRERFEERIRSRDNL